MGKFPKEKIQDEGVDEFLRTLLKFKYADEKLGNPYTFKYRVIYQLITKIRRNEGPYNGNYLNDITN